VYDLQGTMSSIVERYRAGRYVSQVSVTAADDQHGQRLLTCRANPVTSHVGDQRQSEHLTLLVTWLCEIWRRFQHHSTLSRQRLKMQQDIRTLKQTVV